MGDAVLTGLRLGLVVKSTERAIMRAKGEALAEHGLTVAEYVLLMVLSDRPGISADVAGRIALMSEDEVGSCGAALTSRELLRATDGGFIPTAAGRELAARADVTVRAVEARLDAVLTEDERVQVVDLLDRMVSALD